MYMYMCVYTYTHTAYVCVCALSYMNESVLRHWGGALLWRDSSILHQKLLGDGLSTPITPFSLLCTISSELSVILD